MKRAQLLFFLPLAFLGLLTFAHYGESWDELKFYKYADSALEAYVTWPRTGAISLTGNTYDNYGPAYVMLTALGARLLAGPGLPWTISDLRHLLYFFTFLAGLAAFHALCRRWLAPGAALGATLLFAGQPLFWGHAFISPKDMPFLAFFLLSLYFGLRMHDTLFDPGPASVYESVASAWGELPRGARRGLLIATLAWLLLTLFLFLGVAVIRERIIGNLIRTAASGESFLGPLLGHFATDLYTAPPEVYILKAFTVFIWLRAALLWGSTAVLIWLYRREARFVFRLLPPILVAGSLLGAATSIRILGPLAGWIAAAHALWKSGRRAIPMLLIYGGVTLAALYLTWPYLWPDPLGRLIESVRVMSQYPWRGQVLFDGVEYPSDSLPPTYLPTLLAIQLTEPVWGLFAAGLAVTGYGWAQKRMESRVLLTLMLVWFAFPLAALIISRAPLYDNFRQVFFILPPVFLIAGVALERVRRPALQGALILLLILPGIYDAARLHPYEYIYYNRFIGGVSGAFRRFELDYWGTSYREAAAYVNRAAAPQANVWAAGPAHLFALYARPDLRVYSDYESERADHYDFVVATTRYNLDLETFPQAEVVYTIERLGAALTVIKQP